MSQIEPPPNKVAQFASEWKNWLYNLWNSQADQESRIAALEAASGGSAGLAWIESVDLAALSTQTYEYTSIPTTTNRIRLVFHSISSTGVSSPLITIGDSTGYAFGGRVAANYSGTTITNTSGSIPIHSGAAASSDIFYGWVELTRVYRPTISSNIFWTVSGSSHESGGETNNIVGYLSNATEEIDRIKMSLSVGNFDSASTVALYYN